MEDLQKPIIKIENLNVIYNQDKPNEMRALENVNVEIFPQEYVIIFGPSGCGKSTLLYSISGLQRPTSGSITVKDIAINTLPKNKLADYHRHVMGMVFQAFYLVPSINVLDNVCLPKVFAGESVNEREQKALALLQRFNIDEQKNRFPSELSGGQKQRVSIARSLVNDPEIILADEPVGNLDSKSSHNVMMILKELNERDKKTIILVTHDPSHLAYGDRIIHMKDGKVLKVEVVEKKKSDDESVADGSYIFQDGKLRSELEKRGLMKEELVSSDLRLLQRAFGNFSIDELGKLLVPFKVEQLFSYVFSSLTAEQIGIAKKKLEDVFYDRANYQEFQEGLDAGINKGGAGWDKRIAEDFSRRIFKIMNQANEIDFSQAGETAANIKNHMRETFNLHLSDKQETKMKEIILDRIQNRIGVAEVQRILDLSEKKGGLGLDVRSATKVARELELLLLIRYSA